MLCRWYMLFPVDQYGKSLWLEFWTLGSVTNANWHGLPSPSIDIDILSILTTPPAGGSHWTNPDFVICVAWTNKHRPHNTDTYRRGETKDEVTIMLAAKTRQAGWDFPLEHLKLPWGRGLDDLLWYWKSGSWVSNKHQWGFHMVDWKLEAKEV